MEKSFNIRIILLLLLSIISDEYDITPLKESYPKLKKLPSEEYLVIMSKGIYIFNKDFSTNSQLYQFTGNEIINDETDYNKTVISEIKNETNFYVLSLVKENLYLYNHINRNIIKYDISSYLSGTYYNLIPYKIIYNYLDFVIIF